MAARKTKPAAITLKRRDVVTRILSQRGDAAVVTGIGNAVHDVASCGDDARNMYLAGIMGGASMDDAFAVSGFKCLGDLLRNVERILDCNGTAF